MQKLLPFDSSKEDYFYKSLRILTESKNMGYLSVFYNSKINNEGIRFTLDQFKEIFKEFSINTYWNFLPEDFVVTIKFSPINLFKRWIFIISNRTFFKIYEQNQAFEKEFFFYFLKNQLFFFPITTNITHERFLLLVYSKEELKESKLTFTTTFSSKRKLVIYKDYIKKKVSTINFPKNFLERHPYTFRVSVIKDFTKIRFKVYVEGSDYRTMHSIKLSDHKKEDFPKKKNSEDKMMKEAMEQNRKKVFDLLKESHKKKMATNKFANISLGRVSKIPVLVNLPKTYMNVEVELFFKEKEEVFTVYQNKKVIKNFSVSFDPKSNWLEKA